MNTGTMFDAQDNVLLERYTLDEAIQWLRAFNGRGWREGKTLWIPDHNCVVIYDADSNFKQVPQNKAKLPADHDRSPHPEE